MRHLLNTLFVTSEDAYLTLDGENIVVKREETVLARFPLHTLEGIFSFSYFGASPALMGACAERNINLAFCRPSGRFLARAVGKSNGNVLLRRKQYRIADDELQSCAIAKNMVIGKVYNARWSLERTLRDHGFQVDTAALERASESLRRSLGEVAKAENLDSLRGLEGEAAASYFDVFDCLLLNNKDVFNFTDRNRRPPLDPVNAMLSFIYTLLANDCASALEAVGIDSFVGFLHRDRSGRASLSLDLMEELRPCLADRFVITLVNNRIVQAKDFIVRENGSVIFTDEGRKKILKEWQERKKEQITHPFLKEKIAWGLIPHVQSLLLARFLRGDLDEYPPFLWK